MSALARVRESVALQRARPLLGTLVEIAASGDDAAQVQSAINAAFAAVQTVHTLMSYHAADSDVSRINRDAFKAAVTVDAHTWRVLAAAQAFAEASDGLFDVTVAPTLTKIGFLPRHADFPRISGQGDWRHLELLPNQQVRLMRRLRIDLSGIAKGYAVDLAIQTLRDAHLHSARVNAGGDLRLYGDTAQTLHVRHPQRATTLLPLLQLSAGAAATSAGYYASRRHQGRNVMPIIHPHTRVACDASRSVTVVAQDCMSADALTKVVHADPARAVAVLARCNARAFMVEHDSVTGACRVLDSTVSGQWHTRWGVAAHV